MSLVKMPGNPIKFMGNIGNAFKKSVSAPAKVMAAPFKKKPKMPIPGGMKSAMKKVLM